MRILKLTSVLFTFLLLLTSAQPPKQKWVKFKSKEGKIQALFPGSYTDLTGGETGSVTTHKYSCTNNSANYMISYTVHQSDVSGLEQTSLEAFTKQLGGEILKQETWDIAGQKGIHALVSFNLSGTEGMCEYNVLIKNKIQYQAVVAAVSGGFEQDLADKFFSSIKIK